MPAKSEKQKQFMDAAAHNPKFAKAAGVPVSVAKEFSEKSKGMKFGKGSDTSRADLQKVNKPKTLHGKMSIMKEGGNTMATKMKKMNMGGYADGGLNMVKKGDKMVPDFAADGVGKMKKGGMAKSDMKEDMKMDLKQDKSMMQKAVNKHEGRLHKGATMTKLAGGGSFRASANGVATKGKTKGTMIKMNMGGKAC
jgi:hypothetical protein